MFITHICVSPTLTCFTPYSNPSGQYILLPSSLKHSNAPEFYLIDDAFSLSFSFSFYELATNIVQTIPFARLSLVTFNSDLAIIDGIGTFVPETYCLHINVDFDADPFSI